MLAIELFIPALRISRVIDLLTGTFSKNEMNNITVSGLEWVNQSRKHVETVTAS